MASERIKGKLNFGFCHSNIADREEYIELQLIDESSRVHFMRIEVNVLDFARAAFGHRGEVDCKFDLRMKAVEQIGKKLEVKTKLLPWTRVVTRDSVNKFKGGRDTEELSPEIATFLGTHEVDGWMANERDVFNFHRYKKDGVEVSFHRYV